EGAGLVVGAARLPCLAALFQVGLGELDAQDALGGVDMDDVAVFQEADRAADGGLGSDMADAEAAGGAGKATVGDERDLVAHALAVNGGGGGEHLAHARTAARALVADDQHVARLVLAPAHGLVGILFAVEATGAAREDEVLHAGDLHDGALG